jgi:hypothetical protein
VENIMNARRSMTAVLLGALLVGGAGTAAAQTVPSDAPRVIQSDASGNQLSGDLVNGMFGRPGNLVSLSCPVAWGIRTTNRQLLADLLAGSYRTAGPMSDPLPPDVQSMLADLVRDPGTETERVYVGVAASIVQQMVQGLTPSSNRSRGAIRSAKRVVGEMQGLEYDLEHMDPARVGTDGPMRLAGAMAAYDEFIDESSEAFLRAPSDEFLAVRHYLASLSRAALENEGRLADETSRDEWGLVCAPAPEIELALQLCVVLDQEMRIVDAIFLPSSGDTVVVVEGRREPLAERYPYQPWVYAAETSWYGNDEPVVHLGNEYLRYGLPRLVKPEEVTRVGEYRGVSLYASPADPTPETIYVPLAAGCEAQPYRMVQSLRPRG